MTSDSMPIRAITKDGVIEFSPESFTRFEIDIGNGQTVWIEKPKVFWYLNDEPAVAVYVMGPPGAIAHFHPNTGNGVIVTALEERRKKVDP